ATLTALAQWLRWRAESIQTHIKPFAIHQAIGIGGALFMSWLTLQWIEAPTWQLSAMLFAAWYAVIVNVDYMIAFIRKDAKVAGSSLSHIGFGLMLVGILATSVNKRILSRNDFAMEGLNLDEELSRTTLRLTMDQPAIMEDYRLTLRRDTIEDFTRTYFVDYERFDRSTGDLVETFELKPTVLYAKDFSDIVVTNPSTQRYWDKDIFTVIMTMPEQEQSIEAKQAYEDSLNYRQFDLPIGGQGQFLDTVNYLGVDTPVIHGYEVELVNISQRIRHEGYTYESGDVGLEALLRIKREEDGEEDWQEARTAMVIRKGSLFHYPAQNNEYSIRVKLVQDA
ncbi:MAG: cytochrome c assembly protein, partial [Bacteroidota bacterium]